MSLRAGRVSTAKEAVYTNSGIAVVQGAVTLGPRRRRCRRRDWKSRAVSLFLLVTFLTALMGLHLLWLRVHHVLPGTTSDAVPILATGNLQVASVTPLKHPKVFIGIKTIQGLKAYADRLPQIAKTWLVDALENERIHIKFFTVQPGLEPVSAHTTIDNMQGSTLNLASHLIPTLTPRYDFATMTSHLFSYFLEHYNSTITQENWWFCSFDDDNYVLIDNLLQVLDSLVSTKNVYVGRPTAPWGARKWNKTVHFLTGGAGYCLSRDLIERGKDHFCNLARERMPDDMAVGNVVYNWLNVTQIFNPKFHSHLDRALQRTLPVNDIAQQVSFGYNTKGGSLVNFPNVPILFPLEEDPLRFQSLRCFLLSQQGNVSSIPEKCLSAAPILGATD